VSTSNYTSADRLYKILNAILESNEQYGGRVFMSFFKFNENKPETVYKFYRKTIELASSLGKINSEIGGRTAETFEPHIEKILEALLSINIESHTNDGFNSFHQKLS